jgi:hypothetical protein
MWYETHRPNSNRRSKGAVIRLTKPQGNETEIVFEERSPITNKVIRHHMLQPGIKEIAELRRWLDACERGLKERSDAFMRKLAEQDDDYEREAVERIEAYGVYEKIEVYLKMKKTNPTLDRKSLEKIMDNEWVEGMSTGELYDKVKQRLEG